MLTPTASFDVPDAISHRKAAMLQSLTSDTLADLETSIGYRFRNRLLLQEALTHRSFLNEAGDAVGKDNERLEFFGDSILSFCISRELLERFPESREGELTKARAALVDERTLAAVAETVGLGAHLRLGRGEGRSGGRGKPSLLADAFEALVAALYLDGGMEPVQTLVMEQFGPLLANVAGRIAGRDAKTELQELSQSLHGEVPVYRVKDVAGPDHARVYTVMVVVAGEEVGEGEGRSKKEAEQAAAAAGLARIRHTQDDRD